MKRNLILLAALLVINLPTAAAEAPPPVFIDPGVVNEINRDEIKELNIQKNNLSDTPAPIVENIDSSAHESYAYDSGIVVNPTFELKKVTFAGNTVFKDRELEKYFKPLIGKTIYISDVFDAVVEINKMYNQNGYFTSFAYVPPQTIKDNSIVINIEEGKIGQIEIDGNKYSKVNYLKNTVLAPNGLQEGKVFNINDIKKSLDTINSKNYMKGQIAIEEGKKQNSSDLKLKIAERYPLSFTTIWDNGGNTLVGRQRNIMLLQQNNLFGLGHSVYGGTIFAKGTVGALAGYKMPIGKHGTELQFDYSFANVNLLESQAVNRINGRAQTFSTRIVQPLYKSNTIDFKTDLGIDFVSADSMQYSTNTPINSYRLTVLRHGLNLLKYDKKGVFASRFESSFGLPIMGASESSAGMFGNDSTNPQSSFFKVKLDLTRLQKLPKDCYGIFRISSQYSPSNLYASEQMMLGGVSSVRGFEPGNTLGDVGVNGTFEIRTPLPYLKVILPKKIESFDKKVKLGFFYDWGVFSQQNTGRAITASGNLLQSVGAGIHFNLTNSMIASFEVGIPVGDTIYKEHGAMLHFSIKADLWDIFAKKPKLETL